MFFLVYASSATRPFSKSDLGDLLATSRENHARAGITGMLLYKDGNFMQVLEGEERTVRALYEKIGIDPRHKGEITLVRGFAGGASSPIGRWGFATWTRRGRGPYPATASS